MSRATAWALGCAAVFAASGACADPTSPRAGDAYVRMGAAGVFFETSSKLEVFGQTVPGVGARPANALTAAAEIGVFLRPDLSISLVGGIPPKVNLQGTGAIAEAGKLGTARLGLATVLVDYHVESFGRFQPYIGAGPVFAPVFSTTDAAARHLTADSAWGVGFQAGFDYMIGPRVGFYANVTQNLLATRARAVIAGLPVTLKATLNPIVAQTGLTLRF